MRVSTLSGVTIDGGVTASPAAACVVADNDARDDNRKDIR